MGSHYGGGQGRGYSGPHLDQLLSLDPDAIWVNARIVGQVGTSWRPAGPQPRDLPLPHHHECLGSRGVRGGQWVSEKLIYCVFFIFFFTSSNFR